MFTLVSRILSEKTVEFRIPGASFFTELTSLTGENVFIVSVGISVTFVYLFFFKSHQQANVYYTYLAI